MDQSPGSQPELNLLPAHGVNSDRRNRVFILVKRDDHQIPLMTANDHFPSRFRIEVPFAGREEDFFEFLQLKTPM